MTGTFIVATVEVTAVVEYVVVEYVVVVVAMVVVAKNEERCTFFLRVPQFESN